MENQISYFDNLYNLGTKDIKKHTDDLLQKIIQYNETPNNINYIINCLINDSRKSVQSIGNKLVRTIERKNAEIERVKKMYEFDKRFGPTLSIAGTDEVGRGPLAGPIAAAAVILDLNCNDTSLIFGIKDSKKLSPKQREELCEIIKEKSLYFNISLIDYSVIDKRGISWCNNEVLLRACCGLKFKPDIVLSDGYAVKNINIENKYIVKGDAKSASIACASIIAKVYRDNLMKEYSKKYPYYGFENNMGYGTQEHIDAIKKYGPCEIHRLSFLKNIL